MKVKAVFEFNYPDDEADFKVYSKAHEPVSYTHLTLPTIYSV